MLPGAREEPCEHLCPEHTAALSGSRAGRRGLYFENENHHLNIILMILSEYNGKAKTIGSNSNFTIWVHIRWLTVLCITKLIQLLMQQLFLKV